MKMLLMVERGGRVVCAGRAWTAGFSPSGRERHNLGGTKMYGTARMTSSMSANRWWLVEAESADAARELIEVAKLGLGESVMHLSARPGDTELEVTGRILASGGKHE